MSEFTEYPLPAGWRWGSISEISSYVQRGKSPKYVDRSDVPIVNQKCVRWHGVQTEHLKFLAPSDWGAWAPERTLRDGDILWNSTGTGTIGRAAIYRSLPAYSRVVADSHVTIVRVKDALPEYLHAWIRSPVMQARIDAMQTGSTNQVELGRAEVLGTRVPLPPPTEQRRIVAKLDALQTRSRRARDALDAVPPLLEKLRQSILAAAFRGDLTKDWRAKNPNVEPATKLLERIRAERRKKWEESELAKLKAKGKPPTDEKWKAKYKEPDPVDAAGLPELPEGWCWASVEELTTKVVDGVHKKPSYVASGIPFLTVKNLTAGPGISFDELNYVSQADHEEFIKRTNPERGDILISKDGTLGVTRLVQTDAIFSIFVSLALVKPVFRTMSEYLESAFLSPFFQERFKATGSGLLHIHLVDLRAAALPIAPIEEQAVVKARAQDALRLLDAHVRRHADLVGSVATLERAVLAKAFRGELVAQDPSDEPADAMLARVRAAADATTALEDAEAPARSQKRTKARGGGGDARAKRAAGG